MDMTLRVFVAIGAIIMGICIVGCGGDDDDSPAPTVEKKPELTFGLDGDTYRNRRLFKISNLPADEWTIKEVTNKVRGKEEDPLGVIGNEGISLLLMQPTSEADFVDTLAEAAEKEIPYIYIWIEVQSVTNKGSSRDFALGILEQIRWGVEVTNQGTIQSKDRRYGYFYEITLNDIGFKGKASFFVRSSESNRFVYRLEFLSPISQYDRYVSVYDKIVSSIEFRL